MNYQLVSEQAQQYIQSYFALNRRKQLLYHDIHHTEAVVAAVRQIGGHYQLNERDMFVVVIAAWFHDMGYFMAGTSNKHEQKGAEQAAVFLKEKEVDDAVITEVKNCILATMMPQRPVTLAEQIVCDADLFHLGTDDFSEHNKQMRKEYEATTNTKVDKAAWRKDTIRFLQSHQFHTDYCRELLTPKKQQNLEKLLRKENEHAGEAIQDAVAPAVEKKVADGEVHPKKDERPTRGIETMFRIAVTNHQRLSDMADSKANIMISVNAIIISLVIGLVVRHLETTPALVIPTLVLLTGCVSAAIFSVLATRPKIPDGYFSKEQLTNKTVNLLFFGNFYKMSFDEYYEGMKMVMADGEFLYASLIRDIYSQGKVLGNKYKLLRVSYTVFMFTLIISILAFAVATIFFS